ncbi:MAG: D-alanine--D-alanine ligase [Paludibacteraceae bacterium]|nr:D-alanine--D-alanine ligase [Paludibacteraceae bacterium]MBP7219160.1 D-alanine--D-alanine ligase [Paludibacteraceae bacterium]MBP8781619.1 D-alanine--D-alanine ligase [Paludibacteraceae bacterium]MBP9648085.1 D-alanine--D-alanine ligase [Paludibacteraceae bacterium]MBP9970178.1 D-alanine--D-alanine ligase [Paludibacteraceae bacterium]
MKKKIAIIAGGNSSEVIVSLKSAQGIYSFIDKKTYEVYIVTLIEKKWSVKLEDETEVDIDKNDFSFIVNGEKILFDFAYITIHGTPGENGILQGYFDLIGLPYSCCGVLAAAITFNKFTCNQYLKGFGIPVAPSILLRKNEHIQNTVVVEKIGLPCFIKSNVGGSSFGVTKVKEEKQIQPAIEKAFAEGNEVIIEGFLQGTEVTCGMYKTHEKTQVFPITEVVSANEFFDFDAKYNGQVTEITPARIPQEVTNHIQQLTNQLYDILGCKGIIRADFIINKQNVPYLLEVNTTPGMTPTSFIPQQVKAAGMAISSVMEDIIENKLNHL